jgi:hypothetical protein
VHQLLNFILEWNCTCCRLFSVHHEYFTVHIAMVYVILVCRQLASWYDVYHCCVYSEMELSETCRVLFQNEIEKIMHLVGFIVWNLSWCTVTWTSKLGCASYSWLHDIWKTRPVYLLSIFILFVNLWSRTLNCSTQCRTMSHCWSL